MRRHDPRHRTLTLLLLIGALGMGGCGGSEPVEEDPSISEKEVIRGSFDPPEHGHLTDELVRRYLDVMERTRELLEEEGNAHILTEEFSQKARRDTMAMKSKSRLLGTARVRAQMELGVNTAELDWVENRVRRAKLPAGKGDPAWEADQGVLEPLWPDIEAATAGMR